MLLVVSVLILIKIKIVLDQIVLLTFFSKTLPQKPLSNSELNV